MICKKPKRRYTFKAQTINLRITKTVHIIKESVFINDCKNNIYGRPKGDLTDYQKCFMDDHHMIILNFLEGVLIDDQKGVSK